METQTERKGMIWNREMETMARPELERLQSQRLQETMARAYHKVPFYREKYDAAGIRPEQIKSLQDLTRLPFVRKQDLRDHYPFGLLAEPLSNLVQIQGSSGTKGKMTIVGYTRSDLEVWAEAMARCYCCGGGRPGDMFQNAYGYGLFTGGLGFQFGISRAGGLVVPISGGNTPRQIQLIQDFRPRGLGCTPSYALNIADALEGMDVDLSQLSLRFGIFGAEPWSDAMRRQIEQRLRITAVDIYGLSEITGPGVSCECVEAQNGLHVQEDFFYPEIINPDTGEVLPDGEFGELVFTTLAKEALPMLRYRTGDISALYHETCSCGRTTVRMNRIKGRADDMLIIRGVNVFPGEIERELLSHFTELAPHYQLMVDRSRALDTVEVQVEVTDETTQRWGGFDAAAEGAAGLSRRVVQRLKTSIGITVTVTLCAPRSIPRSEGKAIRVVDRRKL